MWVHQVVLTSAANSGNHLTREILQWGYDLRYDGQIISEKIHMHVEVHKTIQYHIRTLLKHTYNMCFLLIILLKWLQSQSDLTSQIETNP